MSQIFINFAQTARMTRARPLCAIVRKGLLQGNKTNNNIKIYAKAT